MKKVITAFLIITLFAAGCSGGITDITEKPVISEKPDVESGGLPDNFPDAEYMAIFTEPEYLQRYYDLNQWQEYMLEKFGLEIYLSYGIFRGRAGGYDPNSIYLLNYNQMISFVSGSNAKVFDLSASGSMHDLTAYYEKYGWETTVDSKYVEKLTVKDGIFALPAVPDKYVIPRYYNKEYLDALSMDVPGNIAEFHEYLRSVRALDDSEDFYPMSMMDRHVLPALSDIFRAYGVYVGSQLQNTLSFDPNSNSFEDAVFSEGFYDALVFIRQLQNERLLGIIGNAIEYTENGDRNNHFISVITKINKKFATEYMYTYDSQSGSFAYNPLRKPLYEHTEGYFLTHTNTSNVCEIRSDLAFYMFPITIENINGTIDLFNEVMTKPEYKNDLAYGIEGKNYIVTDEAVVPIEPSVGGWPMIRQIKAAASDDTSLIPGSLEYVTGINKELAYEMNIFNQWYIYDTSSYSYTSGTLFELFYPYISISDAIENYKQDFLKSGGYDKMIQVNQNIGTTPSYDYGN